MDNRYEIIEFDGNSTDNGKRVINRTLTSRKSLKQAATIAANKYGHIGILDTKCGEWVSKDIAQTISEHGIETARDIHTIPGLFAI